MQEIVIKNMVCPRCIMAVEDSLKRLAVPYQKVVLGKVILTDPIDKEKLSFLEKQIQSLGFEILHDKDVQKIEKIKTLLLHVLEKEIPFDFVLSKFILQFFLEDYNRLSHLFSAMEGITIEKYFIRLKIEKVKELLFYQELNLSEMAWQLGYSSVQHLSSQFKKTTGMTPTDYKKLKMPVRNSLDQV